MDSTLGTVGKSGKEKGKWTKLKEGTSFRRALLLPRPIEEINWSILSSSSEPRLLRWEGERNWAKGSSSSSFGEERRTLLSALV